MACIKELRFIGSTPAIQNGLSCLQETLSYSQGDKGVPVTLRNGGEGLQVSWNGEGAEILYDGKTALFRGLGLLRGMLEREETGTVRERSCFRTNGVMADCSRNHVLSVDGAKALLRYMAAMGLNMLMLYTEDTYQVEGEPYFGYMRGRYSERELREIDDYAFDLGIEVIPCIQSLGHLERLLQWDAFGAVRDNGAVLLADEPATYALLQKMLEAASRPFRSRRIHIGMDETWGLGKGRYLEKHGHCRPQDIYMRHLKQVVKIAGDIGLQPMMWGDMFFALAAEKQQVPLDNMDTSSVKGGGNPLYYNRHIRITEEIRQSIPDGVDIVYWDYYTLETEQYSAFIRMHKELSDRLTFAGGLHSWVGMAIDFDYMYAAHHGGADGLQAGGRAGGVRHGMAGRRARKPISSRRFPASSSMPRWVGTAARTRRICVGVSWSAPAATGTGSGCWAGSMRRPAGCPAQQPAFPNVCCITIRLWAYMTIISAPCR